MFKNKCYMKIFNKKLSTSCLLGSHHQKQQPRKLLMIMHTNIKILHFFLKKTNQITLKTLWDT